MVPELLMDVACLELCIEKAKPIRIDLLSVSPVELDPAYIQLLLEYNIKRLHIPPYCDRNVCLPSAQ